MFGLCDVKIFIVISFIENIFIEKENNLLHGIAQFIYNLRWAPHIQTYKLVRCEKTLPIRRIYKYMWTYSLYKEIISEFFAPYVAFL